MMHTDSTAAGLIPVIELGADSFGPLGLTIGATDQGGGAGAELVTIPRAGLRMADERQFCALVLLQLHEGADVDPADCSAYRAGGCARAGAGIPCALHDPASDVWQAAEFWHYVPGLGILHRDLVSRE